jgi:hypothetical protein
VVAQGFGDASFDAACFRFCMADQRNLSHGLPGNFDRTRTAIAILHSLSATNLTDLFLTWERINPRYELVSPAFASAALSQARWNQIFPIR